MTRTHGKVETTTTTEYLPPTGDQRLARAATDARGSVRFVLSRRSGGGHVEVTKSTERTDDPNPTPVVTSTIKPVVERRPDVYFRITLPSGDVVDTREGSSSPLHPPTRFFKLNLGDRRIGRPEAPLLLLVPSQAGGPLPPEQVSSVALR